MKRLFKSGLAFFAVSFLAVNANAQLASDAPAPQAAKSTVTAKAVTTPAVQTASSMPSTVTKQQGNVTEASKISAKTPAGVEIVTSDNAKTSTVKPTPVVSDQGGVKPVLASVDVEKTAVMPAKLASGPVSVAKQTEEPKADPSSTDKKMSDTKKENQ